MPAATAKSTPQGAASQRAWWLKTLHQWHWISSALCLIGMLLFAFTGITLNHAADIAAQPEITQRQAQLPPNLLALLRSEDDAQASTGGDAPLPAAVRVWLNGALSLELPVQAPAEWSPEEVYLSLPRPGGDAWLRIARDSGEVEYELTDRGWISWLNDLHKGRHTGWAWKWFIDVFSVACLLFSITGLLILKFHAANRPSTWPLVGLGLVAPLLLIILFVHS
ncbi:PepSY-associated TM helix domain-containing protein [Hylemonella gracilis]|uniref:PepSY-associated TM helix domain-containing protein n=1 Tax=Hylemonella gracilis TaxID=80880 RepID=UPI0005552F7C|nr:PepSY-associated TM helix domain-containing protein [Hylemonella gracilis]